MLIYVNGCSHSIGVNQSYSWSYVLGKSICRDIRYVNNHGLDELGDIDTNNTVLYNFSDSGKGNDLIFFETIEFLNKCRNQEVVPDYVLIQWSGPSRFAKQSYDGSMELFTPSDSDIELLSFEPFASNRTLYFISALQDILNQMNVEYSFCCYMDLDVGSTNSETFNNIDLTKFIKFGESHPILGGFRNDMRSNGYIIDAAGHPSYFGHWFLANKFLEKLNIPNSDYGFYESLTNFNNNLHMIKTIMFYQDSMLDRGKVVMYSRNNKLNEGSKSEKTDIRKSLF